MRRFLATLLCLSLFLPLQLARSDQKPMSVAFGKVATVASGTFIFPDFLSAEGRNFETGGPNDVPGLELALPPGLVVTNGDALLCVGPISGGCMDVSLAFTGEIKWADGVFKGDKLDSDGLIIGLDHPSATVFVEQGKLAQSSSLLEKRVEVFGKLSKTGINPLLIVASKNSVSRFSAKLTGKQETQTVTAVATKDWGKIQENLTLLAQTHPNTLFLDGPAKSSFEDIGLGRIGALEGPFDRQTGIMATDVVLSDLYAATFGGRVFGCVTGTSADSFKLRVCLPGPIAATLNVKFDTSTKFVSKGQFTDYKTLASMAPKTFIPCEVIGGFLNDQFTVFARLVRMFPGDVSRYFCGAVKGVEVVDLLGKKMAIDPDNEVKVIYGQGAIEDGKLIEAWFEGKKAIGIAFPNIGILGMQIEGRIEKISNGILYIKSLRSYDYNLFGRRLTLALFDKCKFIEGGFGEVDPNDIEVGTRAVCYGFFDKGGFMVTLVNVLR